MRTLFVVIILGMLASPAMAIDTDLPTAIEAMKIAIQDRLDQIGPNPTGDAKKETKLISKSMIALEKFVLVDKKGLKTTAKAAKLAEKAGSPEQAITDAIQAMIDCMKQLSDQVQGDVEGKAEEIDSEKSFGKMSNAIAKWTALAQTITGLDFGSAAKALAKAITGFEKTGTKIDKVLAKQGGGGGGFGLEVDKDGKIIVPEGQTLLITNICYDFRAKVKGQSTKVSGDAKSDGGNQFPIEWPGGALPFDGSTFIPFPASIPGLPVKITGSFTYKTNFGEHTVNLNFGG